MRFKAILFDKDGTFVDFNKTWGPATLRVMQIMSRGNATILDRLVTLNHFDLKTSTFSSNSPLLAGSSGDYGADWAKALDVPFTSDVTDEMDRLFAEEAMAFLAPIGDPEAVFQSLSKRGMTLGVITNDSEIGAISQVKALGLAPYCSFIAGWDSGYGRKPGPGQINAFLKKTGLATNEVVMVGDTLHDMHAARAAGVFALGVTSGPVMAIGLNEAADYILPSIADIPAWIL